MPVKVQRIGSQEIGNTSEYVATIKSRNSATIMSDVEGWIFAINVKSGDLVKKGQSLMEIDPAPSGRDGLELGVATGGEGG